MKRKEPGIVQLAAKYNKLCAEMATLKARNQAPRGAIIPPQINREKLFDLDVDDDIWQDIGLDESTDDSNAVPLWLGDEYVRQGIKSLLELDRCEEEEIRLSKERCAMQDWMMEEWTSVSILMNECNNIHLEYQLKLRAQFLCRLCGTWKTKVMAVRCFRDMSDSWGPSQKEIDRAMSLSVRSGDDGDNSEEEDDQEQADYEMEEELIEAIEQFTFTDALQSAYTTTGLDIPRTSMVFQTPIHSRNVSPIKGTQNREESPRKRNRMQEEEEF